MSPSKRAEKELADFLAEKPSWLRKVLTFEGGLSADEQLAWANSDWWQNGGKDEDEYVRLVQRIPAEWREYRKRRAKAALAFVPKGKSGAPKKEVAWREQAAAMYASGKSYAVVARAINKLQGEGTTTPEALRKTLARHNPAANQADKT